MSTLRSRNAATWRVCANGVFPICILILVFSSTALGQSPGGGLLERGIQLYLKWQYNEAIIALQEVAQSTLSSQEQRLEAYAYIGASYFYLNENAKTREMFEKCVRLDTSYVPPKSDITLHLLDIYEEIKQEVKRELIEEPREVKADRSFPSNYETIFVASPAVLESGSIMFGIRSHVYVDPVFEDKIYWQDLYLILPVFGRGQFSVRLPVHFNRSKYEGGLGSSLFLGRTELEAKVSLQMHKYVWVGLDLFHISSGSFVFFPEKDYAETGQSFGGRLIFGYHADTRIDVYTNAGYEIVSNKDLPPRFDKISYGLGILRQLNKRFGVGFELSGYQYKDFKLSELEFHPFRDNLVASPYLRLTWKNLIADGCVGLGLTDNTPDYVVLVGFAMILKNEKPANAE